MPLFRKKPKVSKDEKRYLRLLEEARTLSTTDRRASDAKIAEAEALRQRLDSERTQGDEHVSTP